MFSKLTAKLARFALRRADLSIEDRNLLTTLILDGIGALPLRDMIYVNEEGKLLVNGKALSVEGARALRESARGATKNQALKFVNEQVKFNAITFGVHKLETERQSFFCRAALWFGQEQQKLLAILAQEDPNLERELDPDRD